MGKHIYESFSLINLYGQAFCCHFIKYNKFTGKLYESKGYLKVAQLILLFIVTTQNVICAIYSYITSDKVEIISAIAIPLLVINTAINFLFTLKEQGNNIHLLESIDAIKCALSTYESNMNKILHSRMNQLTICYLVFSVVPLPGVLYYVTNPELRLYSACLVSCFYAGFLAIYTTSSLYLLADEVHIFESIINKFGDQSVSLWYCYKCKRRFNKKYNNICSLHQLRLHSINRFALQSRSN